MACSPEQNSESPLVWAECKLNLSAESFCMHSGRAQPCADIGSKAQPRPTIPQDLGLQVVILVFPGTYAAAIYVLRFEKVHCSLLDQTHCCPKSLAELNLLACIGQSGPQTGQKQWGNAQRKQIRFVCLFKKNDFFCKKYPKTLDSRANESFQEPPCYRYARGRGNSSNPY